MLTAVLVWLGVVFYIMGGVSLLMLTYHKTILRHSNPEGSIFKAFYQISRFAIKEGALWYIEWVGLIFVIYSVLLWPIVIPGMLITLAAKKRKLKKQ